MAKYDPLRDHLTERTGQTVTLSLSEIDTLVGGLPASAKTSGFWANDSKGQARAWRSAGWHVESRNLSAERIVFARGADQRDRVAGAGAHPVEGVEQHRPLGRATDQETGVRAHAAHPASIREARTRRAENPARCAGRSSGRRSRGRTVRFTGRRQREVGQAGACSADHGRRAWLRRSSRRPG